MKEPLPCPFCGALPEPGSRVGTVRCFNEDCPIYFEKIWIKDWNTRPIFSEEETVGKLKSALRTGNTIIHNHVVTMQAAWIEWQHGKGAEEAMAWIHNELCGPGHIPDESEEFGKEAQPWFDSHITDQFPKCHCGRPSNILYRGKGACCDEHIVDVYERIASEEIPSGTEVRECLTK